MAVVFRVSYSNECGCLEQAGVGVGVEREAGVGVEEKEYNWMSMSRRVQPQHHLFSCLLTSPCRASARVSAPTSSHCGQYIFNKASRRMNANTATPVSGCGDMHVVLEEESPFWVEVILGWTLRRVRLPRFGIGCLGGGGLERVLYSFSLLPWNRALSKHPR